MVAQKGKRVKTEEECARANPFPFFSDPWHWLLHEIDCHPRLGWFWVALLSLNTLLNVLDLLGFGGR